MMERIRFVLSILILLPALAAASDPPFSGDTRWFRTFPEAAQAQATRGRPILVLFWSTPNRDTERLETDFERWTGISELLAFYVKVSLEVEVNRSVAEACRISSVPSLALIGNSHQSDLSQRVLGILEDPTDREEVMRFLTAGSVITQFNPGELLAIEAEVTSASDLVRQAELDLEERRYEAVFEGLEKAVALLPTGTSEAHLDLHLKLADLYYRAGRFEEAIDHYKVALDSVGKKVRIEVALHLFTRLALLLNDQGENEEAIEFLDKRMALENDPDKKSELEEEKKAFGAGLYVLAGRGYPGVGLDLPTGPGAKVDSSTETISLSFQEKIETVRKDLDFLQSLLEDTFKQEGKFPEFLNDLQALQSAEAKMPMDPFSPSPGQPYQYLHLQDPEDYVLYSLGPDGEDQFGEIETPLKGGERGSGDVVRRRRE